MPASRAKPALIKELDPAYVTDASSTSTSSPSPVFPPPSPRALPPQGRGTIINITSVTALIPAAFTAVYPATKAFVLAFTEALQAQLSPKGVRVQGVLPGATRTAIWENEKLETIPAAMVMDVEEMVDAALAGLDLGEALTVPSLPETADLDTFLAARDALRPNLSLAHAAARYGLRNKN
jgi:short-subunit dehydrogenase